MSSQQSNKVPVVQHAHHVHPLTPLITYSNEHFSPGTPPSHLSPEILDPKTGNHFGSLHFPTRHSKAAVPKVKFCSDLLPEWKEKKTVSESRKQTLKHEQTMECEKETVFKEIRAKLCVFSLH